jgi:hypothetical protein
VALYFVLPQVLPRAKGLAALFAGILHAPSVGVGVFRGAARHVKADKPLCYPDQAAVFGCRFYMEICIVVEIIHTGRERELVKAGEQAVRLHLFCMRRNVSPDYVGPV